MHSFAHSFSNATGPNGPRNVKQIFGRIRGQYKTEIANGKVIGKGTERGKISDEQVKANSEKI